MKNIILNTLISTSAIVKCTIQFSPWDMTRQIPSWWKLPWPRVQLKKNKFNSMQTVQYRLDIYQEHFPLVTPSLQVRREAPFFSQPFCEKNTKPSHLCHWHVPSSCRKPQPIWQESTILQAGVTIYLFLDFLQLRADLPSRWFLHRYSSQHN